MGKHNHKAIITAVVLQQVLGFVWYSQYLFGPEWMIGVGKTSSELDRGNPLPIVAAVLAAIMMSYLMSWLFEVLVIEEWKAGLTIGLMLGVGLLAPAVAMHEMFMGYPGTVVMIDAFKEIFAAGLTGILLATWRADRSDEEAQV